MRTLTCLLALSATGCVPDETSAPAPAPDVSTPSPAPVDTGTEPLVLDDWVAGLQGAWAGRATGTPLGDLPFSMDFSTEVDTAVGSSAMPGFSLDFEFAPGDDGWLFTERGTMGPYVQEHVLRPIARDGDVVVWQHDDPSYLEVAVTVQPERLVFDVTLHGEPHATLDLAPAR